MSFEERLDRLTFGIKQTIEQIDEAKIKQIIRQMVLSSIFLPKKQEIIIEIIKQTKYTLDDAEKIYNQLTHLGLELCGDSYNGYSIRRFAEMRDYVTEEEFDELNKKEAEAINEEIRLDNEHEKKFAEKYGADKSKWSMKAWEEYADY